MSEAAGLTKVYRHSLCETERTRSIVSARRQRTHRSAAEAPVQPIPGDIDTDEVFRAPPLRLPLRPRFGLQEPADRAGPFQPRTDREPVRHRSTNSTSALRCT